MIFYTKRKLFEMKQKKSQENCTIFSGYQLKSGTRTRWKCIVFFKNKTDWYWFDDDAKIVFIVIFYIFTDTKKKYIYRYIYILYEYVLRMHYT